MEFQEKIVQLAERIDVISKQVQTEEATKTSLIMPFFSLLGYDVFNPFEFVPEFTADMGIKKGEKVDYAIIIDEKPVILIEAKSINETLDKHGSQLFRYFATSEAKFGILTNGITYQFFTDLDEPNKMDISPFLEIDLLNIKDNLIAELKKFEKCNFDVSSIFDTASELKYSSQIKKVWDIELTNPSDELIKFFLNNIYDGMKTQAVIDKFRPIIKRSLSQYINEMMNSKIKTAIQTTNEVEEEVAVTQEIVSSERNIITTMQELEAFNVIKGILCTDIEMDKLSYKDNEAYFSILYDNNTRKWICRLRLDGSKHTIAIPDENKKEIRYPLESFNALSDYKDKLLEVISRF